MAQQKSLWLRYGCDRSSASQVRATDVSQRLQVRKLSGMWRKQSPDCPAQGARFHRLGDNDQWPHRNILPGDFIYTAISLENTGCFIPMRAFALHARNAGCMHPILSAGYAPIPANSSPCLSISLV